MFENLQEKLQRAFKSLRGQAVLTEENIADALKQIRLALLEADVNFKVVKDLIDRIQAKAVGQQVMTALSPGEQVIKIVRDELVATLGTDTAKMKFASQPPTVVLMAGLQGSGKTTTSGKLALRLFTREKRRVLLASLDTQRPAAQLQLEQLAQKAEVACLPIIPGQTPLQIAQRAMDTARREVYDVVILDTAGRLSIDLALMEEVKAIRNAVNPVETLLVVDAMTGQDAVTTATAFNEAVQITGIVMTRLDGDARGGAALSMRSVTGAPIKLAGMGEKLDALDEFNPERIAGRILGMGDIVGLVERAAQNIDQVEAEKLAKKMAKGKFDLEDYAAQLKQISKMGSLSGILGMLPGVGKMKQQIENANLDTTMFKKHVAIISSMTPAERRAPDILKASRKKRIAAGSGTTVQEVNKLLKQFDDMSTMMKRMNKMGGPEAMMRQMQSAMGGAKGGRRPF